MSHVMPHAASLERLLRLVQRRLDAHQRRVLGALGLTPRQVEVLMALKGRGGMRQRDLARRVGMDASTLAELASRLDARGLVRRAPHRQDGRALALYLTPKGRRHLMKALPLMQAAESDMLEVLPEGQRECFLQALTVLCEDGCASSAVEDDGQK